MPTGTFYGTFAGAFTNSPRAYPDSLMTEGSLLLVDFANPGGYDGGAVVPVDGTSLLPNVAWETAKRVLGSGDRNSLSSIFQQAGFTGSSDATHLAEWSTKKGLHTIVSQATSIQNKSCFFKLPNALRDYIYTNAPGHDIYFSCWQRITRAQVIASDSQPWSYFANNSGASSNYLYLIQPTGIQTPGTDDTVVPSGSNVAEVKLFATKLNAWQGTRPGASTDVMHRIWNVGSADSWASANTTQVASRILYRLYMEDLTVSGRSYNTVKNLDQALWTTAFASGGRFYNDSYTAPSTLP